MARIKQTERRTPTDRVAVVQQLVDILRGDLELLKMPIKKLRDNFAEAGLLPLDVNKGLVRREIEHPVASIVYGSLHGRSVMCSLVSSARSSSPRPGILLTGTCVKGG